MASETERWLPARLVRRWGAMLWIGPALGLLIGVVLVLVFRKANLTRRVDLEVGLLPAGVDTSPYLAQLHGELASDATLIEVQEALGGEGENWAPPVFWLRPRVKVNSSSSRFDGPGKWGQIHMTFTHHSEGGLDRLHEAFEAVSRSATPRVRAEYRNQWITQSEARLQEVQEAIRTAESKGRIAHQDDIPIVDERDQLKNDLGWLMGDGALGYEVKAVGSFKPGSISPWWQSIPAWIVLIAKCTGYGLIASFPTMFLLEGLRPRCDTPGGSPSCN